MIDRAPAPQPSQVDAEDTPRPRALNFRTVALAPAVLFLPTLVAFAVSKPGVVWPEYNGVFFHLAMLLVIARLAAPEWARAAGYGWITLDVLTGILAINGLPYDLTWQVRMGGHVLAGVWLVVSSARAPRRSIRVVGVLTGIDLAGYSLVGDVLPLPFIYPSSLLLVAWLVLLAVHARALAVPPPTGQPAPTPSRTLSKMSR